MTKYFSTILLFTLLSVSLHAVEPDTKSYLSFDKLNENIYSVENQDKVLGVGFDVKSTEKLHFIIAYEGSIYNEKSNVLATDPLYKVTSYIDGGAISYKLNYKF